MPPALDEREFELVNIVGAQLAANQREISRQMNLSLGMTNMLLRRLISKGYIRIKQLNKKKTEYLLTPKGFSEKLRKSVKYTLKTINSIGLIKKHFMKTLSEVYTQGHRIFYVLGESDFAFLIEVALKELQLKDCQLIYIKDIGDSKPDGVLCICQEGVGAVPKGYKFINFINELAQNEELTAQGSMEI
ncbi:MAG: winged helix-turn-helix transcriptional regulator [Candidatus Omnitrophica bacterium]|nr:winged helix-turn-helix transcriptional regulator [Candidatus Omnitrophota bacterium]MDE2010417.1 winged helix-turn-helix transcriptional regulator [Candidatus Omnitrophota bacterium]MDE2215346.1 winged helix-turn-helix transcriptional regulator [Candidatus Omnitrophota bacterium]MDE2232357.1 winged helix-turn-helix transcriptional regulator [Candidatus Omnitrophota bacterium]